jgi:alkanesulfonate monooxygenase SsuD/methylene tetrahydromethanopterin reductase-like flavin-dependent oxidoreductase (luciferase family)
MMREGVKAIKTLWTQSPANYAGGHYSLKDADLKPKPVQKPHPPIWVAGVSESALSIAVEEGNGWYGWMGLEPEDYGLKVGLVDRLCKEKEVPRTRVENAMHVQASIARDQNELREQAGQWMKKPESFHDTVSCGTPEDFIDLIQRYREAGCDQFSLVFVPVNKAVEQIRLFGETVLPHFR